MYYKTSDLKLIQYVTAIIGKVSKLINKLLKMNYHSTTNEMSYSVNVND